MRMRMVLFSAAVKETAWSRDVACAGRVIRWEWDDWCYDMQPSVNVVAVAAASDSLAE